MRKGICLGLGAALAFAVSGYAQNYKINKVGSAEETSFDVLLEQTVVTEAASGAWLTVSPKVPDGKVFKGFTVYDEYGQFFNQQRVSTTAKDSTHFTMPNHDVYVKATYETLRYSLVVNSTDNGRILITFNDRTRDRTKPGTKVTVTPNPSEGYATESIKVTKKQDENVVVDCVKDTARVDGSCNFDMPYFDVLVSVNYVPVSELSSSSVIESSSAVAPVSSSAVEPVSSSAVAPVSSSAVAESSSAVAPVSSSAVVPASSSSVAPASSSAVAPTSSSAVPASSSAVVPASSSAVTSSSSVAPASSSSAVASSSSVVPASSSAVASSSSVAPASSSSVVASSSSAVPASSSSAKPASSSSAVASSSSAKPASSSSVKASSSSTNASSSSAKPASSSSKPASSSSVKSSSSIADVVVEAVATEEDLPSCTVKRENMTYYVSTLKAVFVCKSRMWSRYNPGPNFIPTIVRSPKFSAAVNGRSLQISGAKVGANVSLFDLQGRVIYNGRADAASFSMDVPQAGSFLLRIGSQQKLVNVR